SCEVAPGGISRNLLINRDRTPFDDAEMRRAMALSIDRRGLYRHHQRGPGRYRWRYAALARRAVGNARAGPKDAAGLRPRRAEEPGRSPRDHAQARLWPRQAPTAQGVDTQHSAVPRSGRAVDRPAEGGVRRRRARDRRDREL